MTTADQEPFADVRAEGDRVSIPELKWRELLFLGALRPEGDVFVRDPSRPYPPFAGADPLPPGVRFRVSRHEGRVLIERLYSPPGAVD